MPSGRARAAVRAAPTAGKSLWRDLTRAFRKFLTRELTTGKTSASTFDTISCYCTIWRFSGINKLVNHRSVDINLRRLRKNNTVMCFTQAHPLFLLTHIIMLLVKPSTICIHPKPVDTISCCHNIAALTRRSSHLTILCYP